MVMVIIIALTLFLLVTLHMLCLLQQFITFNFAAWQLKQL